MMDEIGGYYLYLRGMLGKVVSGGWLGDTDIFFMFFV